MASVQMSEAEFEAQLRQDYLIEASELLESFEAKLLQLDDVSSDDTKSINDLFRMAHTIKGSGFAVKLNKLAGFVHKMENILSEVRDGVFPLNRELVDIMLKAVDAVRKMIDKISSGSENDIDVDDLSERLENFGKKNFYFCTCSGRKSISR